MARALIVGSAGQDGRILSEQLREGGRDVIGLDRGVLTSTDASLALPASVDLGVRADVEALIAAAMPDEIYYLAAFHHSSEDAFETDLADLFRQSVAVHVDGWVNVLEAARTRSPRTRLFYAASSHVFGSPAEPVQNEATPFAPEGAYGITKAAGVGIARFFRARGLHVSCGILYNHESPLRPARFVSQRIAIGAVTAAAAARAGKPYTLELGSLSATVDWSWAADTTDAMSRIVRAPAPDDYVVASGIPHTVGDFCDAAFRAVGLDYRSYVTERPGRVTKRLAPLVGDAQKLRSATGWAPTVSFEEMVRRLVEAARPEIEP